MAHVEAPEANVLAVKGTTWTYARDRYGNPPILLQHRLGKGVAHLVASWCYPGHPGMRPFMEDLMRVIVTGEQDDLRVVSSDRLRYAVYKGAGKQKVFLLNTDPDLPCPCTVIQRGKASTHEIEPASVKVVSL